jgi:thymidine kinase
MFSGKTEELIRRLDAAEQAGARVAAAKPAFDADPGRLVSLAGASRPSAGLDGIGDVVRLAHGCSVIGIDEVQFLAADLADVLADVAARGVRVIAAGLDLDFRGEPFPTTTAVRARAQSVTTLTAICAGCGGEATRSQRLVHGRPAPRGAPLVQVGGAELYEARCASCHVVPASPAPVG